MPGGALPGPPDRLMAIALVLVLAALGGELMARYTPLPRIAGYTLAGWAAVLVGSPVQMPLSGGLRLIVDLALALLLFEIGSQVRLRWLTRNPGLLATSLLESLLAAAAVYWALRWFGTEPVVAACAAVLAMPASAVVAGRVAHELHADGQVTLRMRHLTALSTLYGVLALLLLKAGLLAGGFAGFQPPQWGSALRTLLLGLLAALLLAGLLAAALGQVVRRFELRQEGPMLLLIGLVLLALGMARWVGASTLLVPLLAGLLLRQFSERAWVWPRHFGSAGGVLVLLLFVVLGASWSPALLAGGLLAGLLLLAARAAAKGVAVLLLARWSGISLRQGLALSVALTPLSATLLVMLSELLLLQPQLAAGLLPVLLSALFVAEFLGPLAVRWALGWAHELPASAGGGR